MLKILDKQLDALEPVARDERRRSLVAPFAETMSRMPGAHALVPSPELERRIEVALEAAFELGILETDAAFVFCYAHVESGVAFWRHRDVAEHLASPLIHPLAKARHAFLLRHARTEEV